MATRTHDEQPPIEPTPRRTWDELHEQSFGSGLRLLGPVPRGEQPGNVDDETGAQPMSMPGLSEAQLIGLMSLQRTYPVFARQAWEELYQRHSKYLFVVASRQMTEQQQRHYDPRDAVVDALHAAYDWAGRQPNADKVVADFEAPERDTVRRKALGWMSVITRRIVAERGATHAQARMHCVDVDIDSIGTDAEDAEPPPARHSVALAQALSRLTPTELEAIQVSLPWYDPESGEVAFARGEATKVAALLGISASTLRQRRCRALEHLERLLRDEGME